MGPAPVLGYLLRCKLSMLYRLQARPPASTSPVQPYAAWSPVAETALKLMQSTCMCCQRRLRMTKFQRAILARFLNILWG